MGDSETSQKTTALILCAILFLLGSVAGTVFAGSLSQHHGTDSFFSAFLRLKTNEPVRVDLLTAIFDACKYPLAVLFLGTSVLGVALIPALSAVRGFLLSFSVAAVVRLYGTHGIMVALSMFGTSALITIPCFIFLSIEAFCASQRLLQTARGTAARSSPATYPTRKLTQLALCFALLLLSAVLDTSLTTYLIHIAASQL